MQAPSLSQVVITALVSALAFFLAEVFRQVRKIDRIEAKIDVINVRLENDADALKNHKEANKEEHTKINETLDILGSRDHELANMVQGLWGTAKHVHDWDLPEAPQITRRPVKKAST